MGRIIAVLQVVGMQFQLYLFSFPSFSSLAPAAAIFFAVGVVRYESVRSLPFVLRVVVNQRPTEVQAEPVSQQL